VVSKKESYLPVFFFLFVDLCDTLGISPLFSFFFARWFAYRRLLLLLFFPPFDFPPRLFSPESLQGYVVSLNLKSFFVLERVLFLQGIGVDGLALLNLSFSPPLRV